MTAAWRLVRSSVLPLVLASACGSSSDGPAAPSRADIDAFLERLCKAAAPCCAEVGVTAPSAESCKTILTSNASGYVPDLGEACIREISAGDGGQCFPFGAYPNDPCYQMFNGRYGPSQPGGACSSDGECTAPQGGTSKCRSGKCQWQLPGKPGDTPCVGTSSNGITLYYGDGSDPQGFICDAADGVFCDISARPWTCQAFRSPGQPCVESNDCASGRCSGECTDTPCNDVCLAQPGIGESCASSNCAKGTFCDRTTNICAAPKPVGSVCVNDDECTTGLCDKNTCSRLTLPQKILADAFCGSFL